MSTLSNQQRDWDELARLDPFWAILGVKGKYSRDNLDHFFLSGEREIQRIMAAASALGYPGERETALDFGCGAGRLTRPLADFYQRSYGVDISQRMIELAREFNSQIDNCQFILNQQDHLGIFSDDYFDFIYSSIVLQHLPTRRLIQAYISEFLRVLKAGGLLVFQLPSEIPLKHRLQPRRRLYGLLKALGVDEDLLYYRLKLHPIRMNSIPTGELVNFLTARGARVLEVQSDSPTTTVYYCTK